MLNITKVKLELAQTQTCICTLKKVWDMEFLIFRKDILNTTINI